MGPSYKVAVIGAGTAGLVTARELQREGHHVTVFEKANKAGHGILGLSICEERRLGSEVLRFLEDFPRDFGLMELIRFGNEVVRVELVDEVTHNKWVVQSRTRETDSKWGSKEEAFEAVVICNGKHTEPKVAEFSGRDTWPGLQLHSHNYRTPKQFENKNTQVAKMIRVRGSQIVVVIGNGPSAIDILKEISPIAEQVHHAVRGPCENSSMVIKCAHEDGKVVFRDGSIVFADIILHCTGYKFHFPFLLSNGIITVDDNRTCISTEFSPLPFFCGNTLHGILCGVRVASKMGSKSFVWQVKAANTRRDGVFC
ncbi:hypothetical protein V6N11_077992 [Hibiscus sabdariffa]|uniref:Flavin-containing monooxygenase n=1 Tax=Hibiscus sabdariffa TaxID=183260 RepID=A0ABR2TEP1_9ROSI